MFKKTMGKLNPGELELREKIRKWPTPPSGNSDPDLYEYDFMPKAQHYIIKYRRSNFDPWNSWFEYQKIGHMEHFIREKFWYPNIKPGDVVVDAGAGWGSYALTAAVLGANTYAFEPDLRIFKDLEINIKENNLTNVTTSSFGLSDTTSTIEWEEIPAMHLIRLDDYGLDRLDFLKLDIEGFEFKALHGAQELIKKYRPRMLIEMHLMYDRDILHKIAPFIYTQADGYQLETAIDNSNSDTIMSYFWFEPKS